MNPEAKVRIEQLKEIADWLDNPNKIGTVVLSIDKEIHPIDYILRLVAYQLERVVKHNEL